jgi:Ca-activated chloride channel family protein
VLIARLVLGRRPGRNRVALPALLPSIRSSPFSIVRHSPVLLFLLGLPFFLIAVADPFTSLTQQEVTYPGRRIGLLIDASSSMMEPFKANELAKGAPSDARFFTAVAAAQKFVQMRMKSRFRDLIALIEFGDESYVITPFTNDYDNILLSISLIDDLTEFNKFPDQGTTIGMAINQAVRLFTAFDFLNASGNLMVIFSDGEDTKVNGPRLGNMNVDEILGGAAKAKIPVYFIRTSFNKALGRAFTDPIWKPVVEKTGGKFYAASDEATIVSAIAEIDKVSVGKIAIKQYSTQRPRFSIFALIAASCWMMALALKLSVPYLRKFP